MILTCGVNQGFQPLKAWKVYYILLSTKTGCVAVWESRTISLRCRQCWQTSSLRFAYASLGDPRVSERYKKGKSRGVFGLGLFFWVGGPAWQLLLEDGSIYKETVKTSYFRSSVHISIPRTTSNMNPHLPSMISTTIQNVSLAQGRLIQHHQPNRGIQTFLVPGQFGFFCDTSAAMIISYTLKHFNMAAS